MSRRKGEQDQDEVTVDTFDAYSKLPSSLFVEKRHCRRIRREDAEEVTISGLPLAEYFYGKAFGDDEKRGLRHMYLERDPDIEKWKKTSSREFAVCRGCYSRVGLEITEQWLAHKLTCSKLQSALKQQYLMQLQSRGESTANMHNKRVREDETPSSVETDVGESESSDDGEWCERSGRGGYESKDLTGRRKTAKHSQSLADSARERRQRFLDHPLVDQVEPHRVHCNECDRWYTLHPDYDYWFRNWNVHVKLRHPEHKNNNVTSEWTHRLHDPPSIPYKAVKLAKDDRVYDISEEESTSAENEYTAAPTNSKKRAKSSGLRLAKRRRRNEDHQVVPHESEYKTWEVFAPAWKFVGDILGGIV